MIEFLRKTLLNLIADTGAAEIAEAAAVLPLMFMILLGIFWFGQVFAIYGAITRAAQDGARVGSLPYCTTCSGASTLTQGTTNAIAAVQNDLLASKLDPSLAQYPSPVPTFGACPGSSSSTSCNSTASTNFCVQAPILLENPNVGLRNCGISVSFQYPFQFWLPFTSLNKQRIYIQASAQALNENPNR